MVGPVDADTHANFIKFDCVGEKSCSEIRV